MLPTKRPINEWDELLSQTRIGDYYGLLFESSDSRPRSLPSQKNKIKKMSCPLDTEDLADAKQRLQEKIQRGAPDGMERSGWNLSETRRRTSLNTLENFRGWNVHSEAPSAYSCSNKTLGPGHSQL